MDSALHSNQIMGPFTLSKKKKTKKTTKIMPGSDRVRSSAFTFCYPGYLWRVACIPPSVICHLEIWLTKDTFGAMAASTF